MKKIDNNSFCGVLDLLGNYTLDSHFSVNNNVVSVLPLTPEARKKIHTLSYNTYEYINNYHNWFYGFSEDNCAVAFLQVTPMSLKRISSGINLYVHRFITPIIVRALDTQVTDIRTFDAIEFYGGVVDVVHNRAMSIEIDCTKGICYSNPDIYTKKYEAIEIDGEKFNVVTSITVPRSTTLEIPDIHNEIHSILRFEFERSQPLDKISHFYSCAMKLFQFCTGRLNVRADIRLYRAGSSKPIIVDLTDNYFDYAELDPHNVINLNFLSDKFISLFHLLNDSKNTPYMEFLPQANKYANYILYTNVTDLCVSFEREYGLQKFHKSQECIEAAKKLTDDIFKFIDKQKNNLQDALPNAVVNKAKSLLGSQLKAFSPSLREKITTLYNKYGCDMKKIAEPEGHDILGITKFYSKEKFESLIGKFIDIRNKASHAGVIWTEGKDIFVHLELIIYFSILDRAGFTQSESVSILSYLFNF